MEFFGFGKNFIAWIMLLYAKFMLCVTNNGHFSEWFYPTRGIHQGCLDSGFNFLLCAEIYPIQINKNAPIKGIEIGQNKIETLSQFADNTNLFSIFKLESLQDIIDTFVKYEENTGLKTSYEKTKIFRLGAIKNTQKTLPLSRKFCWSNEKITALGIVLSAENIMAKNYKSVVLKAKNIMRAWRMCNLTLCGKITLINSLIGSLFV